MATRSVHSATHRLTRTALVLAPQRARRGGAVALALLAAAAVAATAALRIDELAPLLRLEPAEAVAAQPAARADAEAAMAQRLEQARLALGLSEARGRELEHQIDTLNQRLRESQDELTFFRKAGQSRR